MDYAVLVYYAAWMPRTYTYDSLEEATAYANDIRSAFPEAKVFVYQKVEA